MESSALDIVLRSNQLVEDGGQIRFSEARAAMNSMDWFDAAVFAQARSMVDWNSRNKVCTCSRLAIPCAHVFHKFCSSCGSPVYSLWAGWKLACTTLLPWEADRAKKVGEVPCASSIGLNNFSHPRTDPVIITVPVNEVGDKILLGRNVSGFPVLPSRYIRDTPNWPGKMGSTCLFCSRGFHGTWRGVRRLYKARIVGGSRSEGLGYQVSLQSTLGRSAHTSLMNYRVHLFVFMSPTKAFPRKPYGRLLRHG